MRIREEIMVRVRKRKKEIERKKIMQQIIWIIRMKIRMKNKNRKKNQKFKPKRKLKNKPKNNNHNLKIIKILTTITKTIKKYNQMIQIHRSKWNRKIIKITKIINNLKSKKIIIKNNKKRKRKSLKNHKAKMIRTFLWI